MLVLLLGMGEAGIWLGWMLRSRRFRGVLGGWVGSWRNGVDRFRGCANQSCESFEESDSFSAPVSSSRESSFAGGIHCDYLSHFAR